MGSRKLTTMLAGGDRRSIGRSNEIVSMVLRRPQQLPELIGCLWSADAIVRMRAADAIEKISLQKADLLERYKADLLELMEGAQQQELRWHMALVIPRLPLTESEQKRAVASLRAYLNDRSSIVKTCALQGLADLSRVIPALRPPIKKLLEESSRTGTAAMRARARKLLSKEE
ncbi:MAG TPA: hypothetical protein VED66_12690 [Candidatus Sulfotelmatobacter sp.]|nr:hypothetical protein [Candidatus Sulfotelmatobacter sp.]